MTRPQTNSMIEAADDDRLSNRGRRSCNFDLIRDEIRRLIQRLEMSNPHQFLSRGRVMIASGSEMSIEAQVTLAYPATSIRFAYTSGSSQNTRVNDRPSKNSGTARISALNIRRIGQPLKLVRWESRFAEIAFGRASDLALLGFRLG
ncbi:MAG: hypothetical protein HY287_10335 [Planctomycetes bacterium]|nr:hypothetical protein [Planctomycetota bacterium]